MISPRCKASMKGSYLDQALNTSTYLQFAGGCFPYTAVVPPGHYITPKYFTLAPIRFFNSTNTIFFRAAIPIHNLVDILVNKSDLIIVTLS